MKKAIWIPVSMRKLWWIISFCGFIAGCTLQQNVPGAFPIGVEPRMHTRAGLMELIAQHKVIVIAQGDKLRLVLPADHFFEINEPTLRKQSSCFRTLDYITALLLTYGRIPILIAGYTDNVESERANCILSQQRADSIRAYLWTHGIEFNNMTAIGYGEEYPIGDNHAIKGMGYNRRIEITLRK